MSSSCIGIGLTQLIFGTAAVGLSPPVAADSGWSNLPRRCLENKIERNSEHIWLVVEPKPLKNMKVSWKNKKCSKPPTRYPKRIQNILNPTNPGLQTTWGWSSSTRHSLRRSIWRAKCHDATTTLGASKSPFSRGNQIFLEKFRSYQQKLRYQEKSARAIRLSTISI